MHHMQMRMVIIGLAAVVAIVIIVLGVHFAMSRKSKSSFMRIGNVTNPVGICAFDIDGTLAANDQKTNLDELFTPCLERNFMVALSTKGHYTGIKNICTAKDHPHLQSKLPPMLCKNQSQFMFRHPENKATDLLSLAREHKINPSNVILFDDDTHNLQDMKNVNATNHVDMKYACSGKICDGNASYKHPPTGYLNAAWVRQNLAQMGPPHNTA
jgi:hypothetical protein